MQQSWAQNQKDARPREESAPPAAAKWGVPATFSLQSVTESLKWWGAEAGAEVLFRAFMAERGGRRFLVRVWLEVYRQIVEEDRPAEEAKSGGERGGPIGGA